jgi:hypothetical protein
MKDRRFFPLRGRLGGCRISPRQKCCKELHSQLVAPKFPAASHGGADRAKSALLVDWMGDHPAGASNWPMTIRVYL